MRQIAYDMSNRNTICKMLMLHNAIIIIDWNGPIYSILNIKKRSKITLSSNPLHILSAFPYYRVQLSNSCTTKGTNVSLLVL